MCNPNLSKCLKILGSLFILYFVFPGLLFGGTTGNLLLDNLYIWTDIDPPPTSNDIEIFEDDYENITLYIKKYDSAEWIWKKKIEDTIDNSHILYGPAVGLVNSLIHHPQIYVPNDTPDFEKYIKEKTSLYIEKLNVKKDKKKDTAKAQDAPLTLTGLDFPHTIHGGMYAKDNYKKFTQVPDISPLIHCVCNDPNPNCLNGQSPSETQPPGACCWIERKENGLDENGLPIFIETEHHCHSLTKANHKCVKGEAVKGLVLSSAVTGDKTDPHFYNEITITVKDRTPPHICDATGAEPSSTELPPLFKEGDAQGKCTTGDFARVREIILTDNVQEDISSRLVLEGRNEGLTETTKWFWGGDTQHTESGTLVPYVFVPNECKGTMRYTILAWDYSNNLNCGIPQIFENTPENCYGYTAGGNLKTGKPWPFAFSENEAAPPPTPGQQVYTPSSLLAALKNNQLPCKYGEISITDNDRPNFVIRIESVKDKDDPSKKWAICFPPPTKNLTTSDPTGYSQLWVGAYTQEDYLGMKGDQRTSVIPLKFTYLDSKTSVTTPPPPPDPLTPPVQADEKKASKEKFKKKKIISDIPISSITKTIPDPTPTPTPEPTITTDFTALNFRLESYSTSDTDLNGDPLSDSEGSFGERFGFGDSAMLLAKDPLTEDVEYLVWIWAEDNVKWSTIPGEHILKSGIKELNIKLSIPNETPPYYLEKKITSLDFQPDNPTQKELDRFTHGPYRFICREPTAVVNETTLVEQAEPGATLDGNKNPYIEVSVKDWSNLERSMRVYFQVEDVKAKMKVVNQKQVNPTADSSSDAAPPTISPELAPPTGSAESAPPPLAPPTQGKDPRPGSDNTLAR